MVTRLASVLCNVGGAVTREHAGWGCDAGAVGVWEWRAPGRAERQHGRVLHQQQCVREWRLLVPHELHALVPQLPLPGQRLGVRDDLVPAAVEDDAAAGRARWQWLVRDR